MKKGVSAVVATVLIIMITIAAVTLIWSSIVPMLKGIMGDVDTCMVPEAEVSIGTTGYTCINRSSGEIDVQVRHGSKDFDLAGLQVVVHLGGNTYIETINNSLVLPKVNQEKVIHLFNTGSNPDFENATKIEIAPIIRVGTGQKTCKISSGYELQECKY